MEGTLNSRESGRILNPFVSLFCTLLRDIQYSGSHSPGSHPEIIYGVPHPLVDIIQEVYTGTGCHVRRGDGVSEDF